MFLIPKLLCTSFIFTQISFEFRVIKRLTPVFLYLTADITYILCIQKTFYKNLYLLQLL